MTVLLEVRAKPREDSDRLIRRFTRKMKKDGIMDEIREQINRNPKKSLRIKDKRDRAMRRRISESRKQRKNMD